MAKTTGATRFTFRFNGAGSFETIKNELIQLDKEALVSVMMALEEEPKKLARSLIKAQDKRKKTNHFLKLPDVLTNYIFSFLSILNLIPTHSVCKSFHGRRADIYEMICVHNRLRSVSDRGSIAKRLRCACDSTRINEIDIICSHHLHELDILDYDNQFARQHDVISNPLMQAIRKNNTKAIQILIYSGVSINKSYNVDGKLINPLNFAISAVKHNTFRVVQTLVEAEADLNAVDDGMTPLLWAAKKSKWVIMKYLLDSGGDPNFKTKESLLTVVMEQTAREDATLDATLVARLVKIVDVNYGGNGDYLCPPIVKVCEKRIKEHLLKLLRSGKCDLNATNWLGDTGLMMAAENGWNEGLKLLLDTGKCDVNKGNQYGRTALAYAETWGNTYCASLLLAAGARREE